MASIPTGATQPDPKTAEAPQGAPEPAPPGSETLSDSIYQLSGIDNRERALPIRPGDLSRLLHAEQGLTPKDRDLLKAFGKFLGATFHSEYYDKLTVPKELYAPLDPDSDYVPIPRHTRALTDRSDEDFLVQFKETMERANYRILDHDIIKEAISAPNEMGLTYVPDFSLFEHLEVWVRGYMQITRTCRSIKTRFRKQSVSLDAYQRLVVALKFKPGLSIGPLVRSDVLYLRMFKDVPHVDMEMHLPEQGTKPR